MFYILRVLQGRLTNSSWGRCPLAACFCSSATIRVTSVPFLSWPVNTARLCWVCIYFVLYTKCLTYLRTQTDEKTFNPVRKSDLTQREQELFELFRTLPKEKQDKAIGIIMGLKDAWTEEILWWALQNFWLFIRWYCRIQNRNLTRIGFAASGFLSRKEKQHRLVLSILWFHLSCSISQ